jgi:hypothetical protein
MIDYTSTTKTKTKVLGRITTSPGNTTMAKQLGIFPVGGSLDNVTFFKTADGNFAVRKRTTLNAERMAAMPAFDRLREHNREFARTGKAVKLLRSPLKALLTNTADRKSALRLRSLMLEVVKTDTTSARGERKVENGDLSMLLNFDFNADALFDTVIAAPFTTTINRLTGAVDITIPAFNPKLLLTAPQQATHFKLVMGAAVVDFGTNREEGKVTESAFLTLTNAATSPLTLSVSLTAATTAPIFVVLGIRFYEETNAVKYPLASNDALAIVEVDQ